MWPNCDNNIALLMADKDDINKRILETRKQTEELKAQLQSLINTGRNIVDSGFHSGISGLVHSPNDASNENVKTSPNKVQIVRSFDINHSRHVNKPTTSKNPAINKNEAEKKESPKKIRNYNRDEAREYIRKQREKRLQQTKFQENEKLKAELQKKKLQELHKKSKELVSKNVQAKRERSNSRDRNIYLRPDEKISKPERLRSLSRDREARKEAIGKGKSTNINIDPEKANLLYPPLPDYVQRQRKSEIGRNRSKENDSPNKVTNTASTKTNEHPNLKALKPTKLFNSNDGFKAESLDNQKSNLANVLSNITVRSPEELVLKSPMLDIQQEISMDDKESARPVYIEKNARGREGRKAAVSIKKANVSTDPNLLYPPSQNFLQRHRENETERTSSKDIVMEDKQKDINKRIEKGNDSTKKIIKSTSQKIYDHENQTSLKPTKLFNSNEGEEAELLNSQKSNLINVLSNITIRYPEEQILKSVGPVCMEKNTMETQMNGLAKECPNWLREQPAQGYPYNFINTVKRQLQYITNTPKPSVDIAIQSSLADTKTPPQNAEHARTKQQLKEIIQGSTSKKSDLKSFMSHKCLNLDPRKIEHLELVTNGRNGFKSEMNSMRGTSETESESDTSKNIPEISSESGTSLKNNAESVRRNLNSQINPAINTDRLDNMKLVTHTVKSATTTIRSETEEPSAELESIRSSQTKSIEPKYTELSPDVKKVKRITDSLSVDDDYQSDFHTDLSRSRESIISSNSPTYNKQIVLLSPQYVPHIAKESKKNNSSSRKNNSSEATTSISKELQFQNIPVAKSTPKEDLSSPKVQSSINTERHSMNIPNTISTRDSTIIKSKVSKSKSSPVFNSLLTEIHPSIPSGENLTRSLGDLPVVKTKEILSTTKEQSRVEDENDSKNMLIKNISLRSNRTETEGALNTTNELHLKFEAEIHLLNDFNASLQQFAEVEKALETLKSKNDLTTSKILQNQDTQTSGKPKSTSKNRISDGRSSETAASEVATVNYSRGSFIDLEEHSNDTLGTSVLRPENNSALSIGSDLSTLTQSMSISVVRATENEINFDNLQANNFAGMSLNMFEQLIKDEDARLENLKAILKIREQVLLDRTKGELAWLEIQRKHFKETGQLHEASVIKKKQRGILVNHQKEKHEMQRMKQMQKAASVERKIVLKEQRNMIRQQLSTDNMLKKMKVNTPRERRQSGPLKVIQRHTESIRSETSVSKRSSNDPDRCQEVLSVTSHHSSVSRLSEISVAELSVKEIGSEVESTHQLSHVKRTLLMRETALKKRKKAAEDLLQWHEKLLEEEKRIAELESTANTIISQKPRICSLGEKYRFNGKQLNQLWYNLTGCESKKFLEDKVYPMSQIALERFCKNAREYSMKSAQPLGRTSDIETKNSVSENIPELEDVETSSIKTESNQNEYPSDFDVESALSNEEVEIVDQSISQLITNFSKIKEDISAFSNKQSKKSDEDDTNESFDFNKTDSEIEISVIETNIDNLERNKSQETGSQLILSLNTEEGSSKVIESQQHTNNEIPAMPAVKSIDKGESFSINPDILSSEIQSSVIENLNDSREILLMLDHRGADKSGSVINDPQPKSSQIESHLSSLEKEELSKEVRNSLSTTENILSMLSQVISEVQEKRSEVSTNVSTREKGRNETIPSENISARTLLPEVDTGEDTEENKGELQSNEDKSAEERNSSKVPNLVSEQTKDITTAGDSTGKLTSIYTDDEEGSAEEIKSSKVSSLALEEMEDINTGKDSENQNNKLLSELMSLSPHEKGSSEKVMSKEASSVHEETDGNVDSVENSVDLSKKLLSKSMSFEEDVTRDGSTEEKKSMNVAISLTEKYEKIDSAANILKNISSQPASFSTSNEDNSHIVEDFPKTDESLKILTAVPDEEDLTDTENTSSESLEQLMKISEAVEVDGFVEKVSIIDDVSPNPSPEEIEESPNKYSSDDSPKETNVDEDISIDTEPIMDQLSYVRSIKELDDAHETLMNNNCSDEKYQKSDQIQSSTELEISESLRLDLSYGIIDRAEKTVDNESESHASKEEVNFYEEKEQDSLSTSTTTTIPTDKEDRDNYNEKLSSSDEKSPKNESVDVKKRVSEILADANQSTRGDKSPRMQDLYVTTYDLISPANSPETGSPINERKFIDSIFGNEAEEILRKQLAIEQEIKAITEQQQKEQQTPHLYVREIPNKPPPPYTPPSSLPPVNYPTIVPTVQEIEEITKYSAKILHKAHLSKNLDKVSISDNTLSLISKDVTKECYKFVFDLCKDISREHYGQFDEEKRPSWLVPKKKLRLAVIKPLDVNGLEGFLNKKLKELFGYEKPNKRENTIIKWSRKKRDHVDEVLVMESQAEEVQWTNYDREELIVMDQVTNEIFDMLLKDTGEALRACFEMS